jgi:(methylthio)acryloyl-CoA hydratase
MAQSSAAGSRSPVPRTCYGLPEGQRGLFVGGGGSVRIPRLMGVARMSDMMLTGRVFDADEGQQAGLSNYLVDNGIGLEKGMALAHRICGNAPLSNFAVIQALPRISELPPAEGLFMESLVAAIAQGDPAAKERMRAFLDGKAAKVAKS